MRHIIAAISLLLLSFTLGLTLTAYFHNNIPWYTMCGLAAGFSLITGFTVWIINGWGNRETPPYD